MAAKEQKTVRVSLDYLQDVILAEGLSGWLATQIVPVAYDSSVAWKVKEYLVLFERAAGGTDEWHRLQSRPQAIKSEDIKLTAEEEERIYGVTKQFIDSESEKKIAEFAGALYSNLSQAQEFHDANPDSGYTWDMEAGDLMKTLARIRKEILSGVASDTLTYVLNDFSAKQNGVPKKKDALDNDRGEF